MYKYHDGAYSTWHGGDVGDVGTQFVGTHEAESDRNADADGFGDSERGTHDVSRPLSPSLLAQH